MLGLLIVTRRQNGEKIKRARTRHYFKKADLCPILPD